MQIVFLGCRELTRKIDTDFYTGKYVPLKQRSTEHILPKSKGGRSLITNYAMTDVKLNSLRGNLNLKEWLEIHPDYLNNMKSYIKKYWNTPLKGVRYGKEIQRTLKKLDITI